jgi:glutaconyl-CoA/methylmalonyl-CoA decarboxylase subunit gamma
MSRKYIVKVNNKAYEVEVEEVGKKPALAPIPAPTGPKTISVTVPQATSAPAGKPQVQAAEGQKIVPAPMTGTIIKVMCQVGQEVKEGDVLLKLEAMKMETSLSTPVAGKVVDIRVKPGQTVTAGEALVILS